MREVVGLAEKDPGANPRRLSHRERTLPVDKAGTDVSARLVGMLAWHRAMDGHDPKCATFRALPLPWPGWQDLMERYGSAHSMSAKGCSPDNAAAEGLRTHEDRIRLSRALGGTRATRCSS